MIVIFALFMSITFHDHEINSRLKDRRRLSAYLKALIGHYMKGITNVDLSFICCTDAYLLSINQDFLKHDTLTDIITFDLSPSPTLLQGEIYVSIERVMENAISHHTTYKMELHRVIFHGTLHLCGLKDKTPAQKKEMRAAEDRCLAEYFQNKTAP